MSGQISSRRRFLQSTGAVSVLSLAGCSGSSRNVQRLSHGVAVGDVTAESAVFWSRLGQDGSVHVEYDTDESFSDPVSRRTAVDSDADNTAKIRLESLAPGTRYYYRAWGEGGDDNDLDRSSVLETGEFRTAPAPDQEEAVTFAWSGDTYGYGRNPIEPPYPGLDAIAEENPDFFVYLGDTIYADADTPAGRIVGSEDPEEALDIFYAKYKEMRDPPDDVARRTYLRKLLETTSVYAMWDDHEVVNNFDRETVLMPTGRDAFFDYWPIDTHESTTGSDPDRLYRSFRWGKHLELFVIDTRQYRDDSDSTAGDKTMLGARQLSWLKESLESSDATFKLIVSSTTMGIVSGDGWTQSPGPGYEDELEDLFEFVSSNGIEHVVVVSGDIHKAQVASFDTDSDSFPEFVEASAGPLGAPGGSPNEYYEEWKSEAYYQRGNDFFNFGVIQVDENGNHVWIEIRHANERGKIAWSRKFSKNMWGGTQTGGRP